MRDILFLAHRLPYPPDRGDRIRSWHVLKALAKMAPVHVCALIDEEADRRHIATVATVAQSASVAVRRSSKLPAIARALVKGTSASVEAFASGKLQAAVARTISKHAIDTIYAFSGQMAQYVAEDFAGRFVMDFVDMDSAKFEALGGWVNRREAKRLRAWETAIAARADVSLFVSNAEAIQFTEQTGHAASVLENGIDFDHFFPGAVEPVATVRAPLIVFTGQMDYAPNIEAVTRFAGGALPQIRSILPDASFAIVGRSPTAAVRGLAGPHVIVTGEVADTRPWLAAANVVVAPLALARGVQNKVLEAMAMAKPVVASTAAALGIEALADRDLIISDNPAGPVLTLLQDRTRADALGQAARLAMLSRYAWEIQMEPLAGFVGR